MIYFIVPVKDRKNTTLKYIRQLKNQLDNDYFIILVDDGSTDGTSDAFRREVEKNHRYVIVGDGNLWWGGSLHKAWSYLKSRSDSFSKDDLVVISNDDVYYSAGFISLLRKEVLSRDKSVVSAFEYCAQNKRFIASGVKINWNSYSFKFNEAADPDCVSTRTIGIRVFDFLATGGFRPVLLPHYLSDYEFTFRCRKIGMCLIPLESLKVFVDIRSTGQHRLDYSVGFIQFYKNLLSKRSAINPIYMINFIALCAPTLKVKIVLIIRIVRSIFRENSRYFLYLIFIKNKYKITQNTVN